MTLADIDNNVCGLLTYIVLTTVALNNVCYEIV